MLINIYFIIFIIFTYLIIIYLIIYLIIYYFYLITGICLLNYNFYFRMKKLEVFFNVDKYSVLNLLGVGYSSKYAI